VSLEKARDWAEAEADAAIRRIRVDGHIYIDNVVGKQGNGPGKKVRLNGHDVITDEHWSHTLYWPDRWRGTEAHVAAVFKSAALPVPDLRDPGVAAQLAGHTLTVAEFWPTWASSLQVRFAPPPDLLPIKVLDHGRHCRVERGPSTGVTFDGSSWIPTGTAAGTVVSLEVVYWPSPGDRPVPRVLGVVVPENAR
jgi:hypothetical protein